VDTGAQRPPVSGASGEIREPPLDLRGESGGRLNPAVDFAQPRPGQNHRLLSGLEKGTSDPALTGLRSA
jgi:hypothetical protein